uniref:Uncharacterized protein n=1 Tax=Anguilla anguilla TaxID=7936 RepID=A0A0E9SFX3_ANGAN
MENVGRTIESNKKMLLPVTGDCQTDLSEVCRG